MKRKDLIVTSVICVFSLLACFLSTTTAFAASKQDAYKAYYPLVKELYNSKDEYESYDHFKLLYVDADNIPELLAVQMPNDLVNNSTYFYKLYTYYDGQAVELGEFRSGVASAGGYRGSTAYIKKSGKIYETSMSAGSGDGSDAVYKLSNGELKVKGSGEFNIATGENEWKGKSVSSTTYNKKLNKLFNTKKGILFEELKLNSYSAMLKKLK